MLTNILGRLQSTIVSMAVLAPASMASGLPQTAPPNYAEALQKSLYFYEAQMSGELPPGHRVNWRGPSALDDGADVGVDLSGGMYDAGDHVKFAFPYAFTTTMLAWSLIEDRAAYAAHGQLDYALNNLKWMNDWLLKAHSGANEFWGQVGNGGDDHAFWGAPEVMRMRRPAYKIDASCPGSDLAGEAAAAMAASSMVFASVDAGYAAELLRHARELYAFADLYRGKYSDCIRDASGFYMSFSGYQDELVWAAAWLYRASGDAGFLSKAEEEYQRLPFENGTSVHPYKWTLGWDDKSFGSYVLLAGLSGKDIYHQDAQRWLDYWTTGVDGQRVQYTPGGLAWLSQWGSLRYVATTAAVASYYAAILQGTPRHDQDRQRASVYQNFAKTQAAYILGANPEQRSYVVGYGERSPRNVHHRGAHGSWTNNIAQPATSRHVLYGALVGGPDQNDHYVDARDNFVMNEVALDYNAGWTALLSSLAKSEPGQIDSNFPPMLRPDQEYAIESKVNARGSNFIEMATRITNMTAFPARAPATLSYRYILNLSELPLAQRDPRRVTITTAYNQSTSISDLRVLNAALGLYYIEVHFADQWVAPAGQSESRREVQFRFNFPSEWAGIWDNSNDWSFLDAGYDWQSNDKLPVYEGGNLVYGQLPH